LGLKSSTSSLGSLSLFFFVSANLSFDSFPVNLEVLAELLELFVGLLLLVHFEEALPVRNNGVDMSLVVDSDLERTVPLVQLNVQLNCSVEQTGLQKDALGLSNLLLVNQKGGITCWLRWQLLNVVNKLDLVCLVDSGQSNFNSVEFSLVD
jgi:hypothetical protein